MDKLIDIAKRSVKTLWANKYLWFFGFFVATLSASGRKQDTASAGFVDAAGAAGAGASASASASAGAAGGSLSLESIPGWAWALMALGLVLGLIYLALHMLSEAALIRGVADGENGARPGIREGLRQSRKHFWRVTALKLGFWLAGAVSFGILCAPLLLAHFALTPLWAAVTLVVILALAGLPWILTLFFWYEYSLRFAVLEDRNTVDAFAHARRFLHGRIGLSIKLTLLSLVGYVGGWITLSVALLPALVLAGIGYLIGGVIPAVVLGSLLGVPIFCLGLGAVGTFRSSVWTLGFMDDYEPPCQPPRAA